MELAADAETSARALLARARATAGSGRGDAREAALRLARQAGRTASAAGLEELFLEALHAQVGLEDGPLEQIPAARRALRIVRRYPGATARGWEAALLQLLGSAQVDADRVPEALASFRAALALREDVGAHDEVDVARDLVAWATRLAGALRHPS